VVARQLGKVGTVIYLGGVAVGSLLVGLLVQAVAPAWHLGEIEFHEGALPAWLGEGLAVLLVAAIVAPWLIRKWRSINGRPALRNAEPPQPRASVRRG
jgi:MFS family permease